MSQYNPPSDPMRPSEPPAMPAQQVRVAFPTQKALVTYWLIGITIVIYLLQMLSGYLTGGYDIPFTYGGKINEYILAGQLWRLITPVFLHASILHVGFNMYALYVIGPQLERAYGHRRFLLLYLLAGFAGNVLSFVFTPSDSLGASTAIFGLIAAQGVFIYQNRALFGSRSRAILINLVAVAAINFGFGLIPNSMIDNFGHLGGLLGGAVFAWLAGPRWSVEGLSYAPHVEDHRSQAQIITGALIVLVIFGGIVLIKFLMG